MKELMDISEKLQQLDENEKFSFRVGKRTYKIGRLSNWTSREINKLIFKLRKKKYETADDILESDEDRKLIPQVISLAILRTPLKIRMFHWYLWRKLDKTGNQREFERIISIIIDNSDMAFFSKNLTSLHAAAMMETGMTKEIITTIAAKQKSEQETT